AITRTVEEAKSLHLSGMAPCITPTPSDDAPRVLIFSPHPDDECIVGTLPLRLLRESRFRIINIAVTLGSRKDRRPERLEELKGACQFLGFEMVQSAPEGLESIKPETRQKNPALWKDSVEVIRRILTDQQPQIIFIPHAEDWNGTHIGTHKLVCDALTSMAPEFACFVVETEYWHPMKNPNLMVECQPELVADLIAGLSFHAGEIARNPYHLSLPAWMQDNVRRGSELIGGQGGEAPAFHFATLYRLSYWCAGALNSLTPTMPILNGTTAPNTIFPEL
ncbi:MAG: PIG-L deacetylase family protein, partial [Lentisphaeria bacterium]